MQPADLSSRPDLVQAGVRPASSPGDRSRAPPPRGGISGQRRTRPSWPPPTVPSPSMAPATSGPGRPSPSSRPIPNCRVTSTPIRPVLRHRYHGQYIPIDGGEPIGAGQGEATLDIEDIIGLAPEATIDVYQQNESADELDAYTADASQHRQRHLLLVPENANPPAKATERLPPRPHSWRPPARVRPSLPPPAISGSEDCEFPGVTPPKTYPMGVDDPHHRPLSPVWRYPVDGHRAAPDRDGVERRRRRGGGRRRGVSGVADADYQSDAPSGVNVINANSSSVCRGTPPHCREVPDVSADASPESGYAIYFNGKWVGNFSGTSAAAPLWAAFLALTNASPTCLAPDRLRQPGPLPGGGLVVRHRFQRHRRGQQ